MSESTQPNALSSYAFQNYSSDAKLYNGVHALEETVQRLEGELADARNSLEISRTQTKDAFERVTLVHNENISAREKRDKLAELMQKWLDSPNSREAHAEIQAALAALKEKV